MPREKKECRGEEKTQPFLASGLLASTRILLYSSSVLHMAGIFFCAKKKQGRSAREWVAREWEKRRWIEG